MTMKKLLKVIQLADAVVRFIETILHVKFINTVLHDMDKGKEGTRGQDDAKRNSMLNMLYAMASLVDMVGTSQFFTKQLWKDVWPDATTREVLSVFITSRLYDHGVYAYYGPYGTAVSDKEHIQSFLKEHSAVLEKYAKWSRGGKR